MTHTEPPFESSSSEGMPEGAPTEWEMNAQKRILELEAQIEELKKDKLLALAEAENAGKRADKRVADNAKYAVANIAKALLTVADNLSRALLAAPPESRAANEALKNLSLGVELTEKELHTILENQGVRRVQALNQPFDPNLHNAIQEVENTSVPAGTVVQVFQDGYMMHDRLLRPAMVVVSRGGPKREAAPAAGAAPGVDTKI
ncbi:MAG: nucleotide exchange factor GrpE [Rhodospirillaceae bacterium]